MCYCVGVVEDVFQEVVIRDEVVTRAGSCRILEGNEPSLKRRVPRNNKQERVQRFRKAS